VVLPGQYLERSLVVGDLDALYHRGRRDPPCVLSSPHPALGGSMVAPVVAELAWALTRAGHATMRFDYRGVGASRGHSRHVAGSLRIGEVSDEVVDLFTVTDQLLATANAPAACAIGYSFGAKVALEAARDARISHLVLVAPPNRLAEFGALATMEKPVLVVCAHHDPWCDRQALRTPEGARVEVIPASDHFFARGLTELGKAVATWLRADRPELVAPPDRVEDEPLEHRELELEENDEPPLELDTEAK
jgi:alpha/beta superfamily hydrolase